jgi:hypothetical protein
VAVPSALDGHEAAGRVVEGVLDQVVEHDREVFLGCACHGVAAAGRGQFAAAAAGSLGPALLRLLDSGAERHRCARGRPIALPGQCQQRRQELREALDLLLGRLELLAELRACLQRRRLEPQPQAGQRRSQLMRGVGDELPLRLEHLPQPLGHVVERVRDLAVLGGALGLGPRLQIAGLDATRGRREPLERPGQRPGEKPGEREAEHERDQPDADQAEHVAADPAIDRLDVLGHAHGADPVVALDDRDGREEQRLAERLAEPASLSDSAILESRSNLRPVGVRPGLQPGRVGDELTRLVDDDDATAEIIGRFLRQPTQLVGVVHPPRCAGGDQLGLGCRLALHLGIHPP